MVTPSPPIELVTLDQVKRHIRPFGVEGDQDIEEKIEEATAIVLEYIERPSDDDWTATILAWTVITVPRAVRAAILRQVADLYRFRGDDETPLNIGRGRLSRRVEELLEPYRDPPLA